MKRNALFLLVVLLSGLASAQNLQLHFDPRHGLHSQDFARNYFTVTFEMFKPDKWGSTFIFVDFDLNQKKGNSGLAYMEIARDIKLGNSPIMAHAEFNGGFGKSQDFGFAIPNSYLVGPSYATNVSGWNLGTYLVYKYHSFDKASNDAQWTLTWGKSFCNNKITFTGFFDIWTENKNRYKTPGESGKQIVLLTEPQLWYNATSNLSFGTEIEISNNFLRAKYGAGNYKAFVNPTLAAKWNF